MQPITNIKKTHKIYPVSSKMLLVTAVIEIKLILRTKVINLFEKLKKKQ